MEDKKYDFAKVSVRPATKREIDVLAAMRQRPVYELVAEMLEVWKLYQLVSPDGQKLFDPSGEQTEPKA